MKSCFPNVAYGSTSFTAHAVGHLTFYSESPPLFFTFVFMGALSPFSFICRDRIHLVCFLGKFQTTHVNKPESNKQINKIKA